MDLFIDFERRGLLQPERTWYVSHITTPVIDSLPENIRQKLASRMLNIVRGTPHDLPLAEQFFAFPSSVGHAAFREAASNQPYTIQNVDAIHTLLYAATSQLKTFGFGIDLVRTRDALVRGLRSITLENPLPSVVQDEIYFDEKLDVPQQLSVGLFNGVKAVNIGTIVRSKPVLDRTLMDNLNFTILPECIFVPPPSVRSEDSKGDRRLDTNILVVVIVSCAIAVVLAIYLFYLACWHYKQPNMRAADFNIILKSLDMRTTKIPREISRAYVKINEEIGSGNFSTVYKGIVSEKAFSGKTVYLRRFSEAYIPSGSIMSGASLTSSVQYFNNCDTKVQEDEHPVNSLKPNDYDAPEKTSIRGSPVADTRSRSPVSHMSMGYFRLKNFQAQRQAQDDDKLSSEHSHGHHNGQTRSSSIRSRHVTQGPLESLPAQHAVPGGFIVAVKSLKHNMSQQDEEAFLREAAMLTQFSWAPHIVHLVGVVTRGKPCLLIMEYCSNGSLSSFLQRELENEQEVCWEEKVRFCMDIADGMQVLTNAGGLHRDLSARNVFVTEDRRCKVGDFGLAKDKSQYEATEATKMAIRWTAPEALNGQVSFASPHMP